MLPQQNASENSIQIPKSFKAIEISTMMVADTREASPDTDSDEMERSLSEHVDPSVEETVEQYSKRKENEFPSIFEVAATIYGTVTSELNFETNFSLIVVNSQLASRCRE